MKRGFCLFLVAVLLAGLVPCAFADEAMPTGEVEASEAATEAAEETTAPPETAVPSESTEPPEATETTESETEVTEPEADPVEDVPEDAVEDDRLAAYASTVTNVLLFDKASPNYTTVLRSQVPVTYNPNGSDAAKTAYIKNLGWHFARYNKIRLTNMLRSGKELKVFAVKDGDLQEFCQEAKKYGVLYCVLKDKNATDGITDIMVRAEDAAKVNRIFTRFGLATVDLASLKTEIVKEQNKARTEEDADVRSGSDKPHNDDFVKELFGEDPEKHIVEENPLTGRTEAEHPSESTSLNRWGEEIFLDNPPSVREAMKIIRQERAASQPQNTIAEKAVEKIAKGKER